VGKINLGLAIRVRPSVGESEKPSFLTLCTSFLLFCCHHALDKDNSAWIYLREALTLVFVLGLHTEESYHVNQGRDQSEMRRKMFWILFIAERYLAPNVDTAS
jgi:hypothetical protein